MKGANEITRIINNKLEKCPNCEHPLTQIRTYALQCKLCGTRISVETRNERVFLWGLIIATISFGLGMLVIIL